MQELFLNYQTLLGSVFLWKLMIGRKSKPMGNAGSYF